MRRVAVAAAAVVGIAVLAGCSDGEQANETLPSTSVTAAEPSETTPALPPMGPADFPMPVEAREMTEAGAEAFLDYYLAVEARSTEGEPIRQLSRECSVCRRVAEQRDADAQAGNSSSGGDYTISIVESIVQGDQSNVIFTVNSTAVTIVDSNGTPIPDRGHGAIIDRSLDAFMVWDAPRSTWLMTEFAQR